MRRRLRKMLLQYASESEHDQLREQELVCLVVHLVGFGTLCAQTDLAFLGSLMNSYYGAAARALMHWEWSIDRFCGPSIVAHAGLRPPTITATAYLRAARSAVEELLHAVELPSGVELGVGLCSGRAIYGRFGSPDRATVTAFGPPVSCAGQLAMRRGIRVCERVGEVPPFPPGAKPLRVTIEHHRQTCEVPSSKS
jgi:class 3 adenylate cyclase